MCAYRQSDTNNSNGNQLLTPTLQTGTDDANYRNFICSGALDNNLFNQLHDSQHINNGNTMMHGDNLVNDHTINKTNEHNRYVEPIIQSDEPSGNDAINQNNTSTQSTQYITSADNPAAQSFKQRWIDSERHEWVSEVPINRIGIINEIIQPCESFDIENYDQQNKTIRLAQIGHVMVCVHMLYHII